MSNLGTIKKEIESSIVKLEAERRAIDDQLRTLLAMLSAGETRKARRKSVRTTKTKTKSGRKPRLAQSVWTQINAMLDAGVTHPVVAKKLKVSVSTVARARAHVERSAA